MPLPYIGDTDAMTSTDSERPSRPRPAETLAAALSDVRAVLAVVGLVLYIVLRVAYDRFYRPLGLSPDDLGLSYFELLAQSAIGAVAVLTFWGLVMLVALAVDIGSEGVELGARVVAAMVLWVLFVVLGVLTDSPVLLYPPVAGAVVTAAILGVRGISRIRSARLAERRWHWVLTAAVIGIFGAGGHTLITKANDDARSVRDGRWAQPAMFGVRFTSWGAEAAKLSWTTNNVDPTLRSLADSCVMYLGESDGTLFVYSPRTPGPATFRVPATAATVRIFPRASCTSNGRMPTRQPG